MIGTEAENVVLHSIGLLAQIAHSPAWLDTLAVAEELYDINARLWNAEDRARNAPNDTVLAETKRLIDQLNIERNGCIERLDELLAKALPVVSYTEAAPTTPMHTETIGSVLDRLVILALRVDHTKSASVAEPALLDRVAVLTDQYRRLECALESLVRDVAAGRRQVPDGRRFKLYGKREARFCDL